MTLAALLFLLQAEARRPPAGLITVWYLLGFGAIFYFLFIRPQRQQTKRHKEMLGALKRGDEVVTAGGVVGQIVHIKDDRLTLKSGESKLIVERGRVARLASEPESQTR